MDFIPLIFTHRRSLAIIFTVVIITLHYYTSCCLLFVSGLTVADVVHALVPGAMIVGDRLSSKYAIQILRSCLVVYIYARVCVRVCGFCVTPALNPTVCACLYNLCLFSLSFFM